MNSLDKVHYWYCKAAELDNKLPLYELGKIYEFGKGVWINKVIAFEFYKKSANQGFAKAQYRLGNFYEKGVGIDMDKEKAFDFYKMAANSGFTKAQNLFS